MKKVIIFLLGICAIMGLSICVKQNSDVLAASYPEYYYNVKFGDVNDDGIICVATDTNNDGNTDEKDDFYSIADNVLVQQHMAANMSEEIKKKHPEWILKGKAFYAADVNQDGEVDITDSLCIQRHDKERWEIITITFSETGGKTTIPNEVIRYDSEKTNYYKSYAPVSRDGYKFEGWYTAKTGGTKVTDSTVVTNTVDHTLYAHWTPIYSAPTVTGPSSISVTAGTNAKFSVNVSGGNPSNYTYQWYYSNSITGSGYIISGAKSSTYSVKADTNFNGRYYFCKVSNGQYTVNSSRARITVNQKNISGMNVLLDRNSFKYSGQPCKPLVTISGLTKEKDYSVSYKNNVNAGTATVLVSGKGNYEGTIEKSFSILKGTTIIQANSITKPYKSKAFSLGAVTNNKAKLTYVSNNTKTATVDSKGIVRPKKYGKATITISAAASANYTAATKKITIQVVPRKMTLKSVTSPGKKKLKMKWKKDSTADGYQIYISNKKNFSSGTKQKTFKKKSDTYYGRLGWVKSGKKYYVKIRAYKKVGKTKYYGEWSKVKSVLVPYAASRTINITGKYLGYSSTGTVPQMKRLKRRIGGMSQRKNEAYPDYYASGKKMKIGVNKEASAGNNTNYLYISNSGNKRVKLLGVQVGMSAKKAKKKLIKAGLYPESKRVYYWGDAAVVILKIKRNKVVGYKYICAPTS